MVLIQLLLPATLPKETAAGDGDAAAAFAATRRELADTFDGLTAYVRSPAEGLWTGPDGRTERDDVVMVEVVTDRFDRTWWRSYVVTLARRFRQQTIHVRAMTVELLEQPESLP